MINEDALGLDKIYVQAKRYSNQVSRPVRSFAGSLDGAHARKGVMITTSSFSPDAYRWVERLEKQLVLIDGAQLVHFMIDHEVGSSGRQSSVSTASTMTSSNPLCRDTQEQALAARA